MKSCAWCASSFEAKRATAKFCTPACRLKAHRAKRPPVLCEQCGAEMPRKKRYCGPVCRAVAQAAQSAKDAPT